MVAVSRIPFVCRMEKAASNTWSHVRRKIIPVALEIIKMVGRVLLNILTLGLYTTVYNELKKRKIAKVEEENEALRRELPNAGGYPGSSGGEYVRLTAQIEAIKAQMLVEVQSFDELRRESESSKASQKSLQQDCENGFCSLQKLSENNQARNLECQALQEQWKGFLQDAEQCVTALEGLRDDRRGQLNQAQSERDSIVKQLSEMQQVLADVEVERQRIHETLQHYGPTPARYKPRPGDLYKIPGDYAQAFNGIATMPELLGKALEETVNELLEQSDRYTFEQLTQEPPPANASDVHFSKSPAFYQVAPSHEALFQLAALKLIAGAELRPGLGGPEGSSLILNDQSLQVRWSRPYCAPTGREGDIMLYSQVDDWTPEPGNAPFLGVDPVSVKRIWNKLSEQECSHLQTLLVKPFMLDDNPRLQAAEAFIAQEDGKFVKLAYELLSDIGVALKDAKEQPMIQRALALGYLLDDYGVVAFRKPNKVEQNARGPFVPWEFDTTALESSEVLFDAVLNMQTMLQTLSDNMSQGLLSPTGEIALQDGDELPNRDDLYPITRQYHMLHYWKHHGCLFDGLASILFRKVPGVVEGQLIKNAMAVYLDTHREFDEKITFYAKLSVSQYKSWLRGEPGAPERSDYDLGTLELEIVAFMLGVSIGVLAGGKSVRLDEYRVLQPTTSVGPNTAAQILLHLTTGVTFRLLLPMVRESQPGDSAALAFALSEVHRMKDLSTDDDQDVGLILL